MVLQQKRAKWPGMEGKRWQRERERETHSKVESVRLWRWQKERQEDPRLLA
jgi:hypothetical protein